ncbi:hypothetical protein Vretimale_3963 [Volvox reticuliferus]|uniref:Uncharacterized protein n=1 Tax=Volvox reticuliferus TaxID=1737510 RepID=A0A8J4G4W4_9CHLO|nr:hypothetical protein Vretifemale_1568 [Volvox reticuliferus]GIL98621.1 hypothetical protein Vretimale_3963 [Volvox reticuliferus]
MPDSPRATASSKMNNLNDRPPMQLNHIELCRRPLRRTVPKPQGDKTGTSRLRGRGVPPPNGKEWEYHPSKQFIPGKSFASSLESIIKQQRDRTADEATPPLRTSVRISDRSHASHLSGGGVEVVSPVKPYKPLRRMGSPGPKTARVLGIKADDTKDAALPTYALLGTARRDVFVTSRPTTAPACVLLTNTGLRSGYENARSAYDDVVQYRHSGGICPPDYKMVAERPAAPQLGHPGDPHARNSFLDSQSSYRVNKMRGQMSEIL